MNTGKWYFLGRILRTHGNKGHMLVRIESDDKSWCSPALPVFFNLDGELVPYFIESFELKQGNTVMVKFEDIDDAAKAGRMVGVTLSLPPEYLPPQNKNRNRELTIYGYSVYDTKTGNIGIVESILEWSHQSLLLIRNGNNEIMIPMVDSIILKVDRRKKQITIEAPDGLIDLNL